MAAVQTIAPAAGAVPYSYDSRHGCRWTRPGRSAHARIMDDSGFSGDEVEGVLALRALRAGDLDEAAEILSRTRPRYSAGFLLRLAIVAPGVAIRTAWRLLAKQGG